MRIAIVDDEPSLLKLATHKLEDFSKDRGIQIEVSGFDSGDTLLNTYEVGYYDMIFMDVFMPGIDGIETIMKVRALDPTVAVVFLTASEEHMKNALKCHAFDYIVKPAARDELYNVVDDCVKMLGEKVVSDTKIIEFVADKIDVKLASHQLMSVSVQGHNVSVCDSAGKIYTLRSSFASIVEQTKEWDNMLIINRGVMVNMNFIHSFDGNAVRMKDGYVFYARIKTAKELEQKWIDYRSATL